MVIRQRNRLPVLFVAGLEEQPDITIISDLSDEQTDYGLGPTCKNNDG